MTSALLKSINTKNQLYKEWIKTDVNDLNLFLKRKDEFKSIIKNKSGNYSDKANYRPIALVTACSKIFESCLLIMLEK